MKKQLFLFSLILGLVLPAFQPLLFASAGKIVDPWSKWLDELKPIITAMEMTTFKLLNTEEDKKRFLELFWKARDTNPATPENEYKIEFYKRLQYVREHFHGPKTDRGKIYLILGQPFEIKDFSGEQDLVACQMWVYHNENRPGLLPFINLLFFQQRDFGEYRLFYPGIHGPVDLLNPNLSSSSESFQQAFNLVRGISSELAMASLSVVPGEGDPYEGAALSTSNFAIGKIYSLPEFELRSNYLRNFRTPRGVVRVSESTKRIMGRGIMAVSRNKGFTFLNFALMPEILNVTAVQNAGYTADIRLYIQIEDARQNVIFQDERKIMVKLSAAEKKEISDRKVMFRDFIPLIPGDFMVQVTFINKSTDEFFTMNDKISIQEKTLPVLTGFKINEIKGDGFMSFSSDKHLLLNDPRLLFSQKDTLEGIVMTDVQPEIVISNLAADGEPRKIENVLKLAEGFRFSLPLAELPAGTYLLTVKTLDGKSFSQKIFLESAYINLPKPLGFEKIETGRARNDFIFILAQEYLNSGQIGKARELLSSLPDQLLNSQTLPVMGRAFYLEHNYAKALEILEREPVEKNLQVLIMLANAALELKQYQKAVGYLENVRKYGDTAEINHLLAAAYLSIGDKAKARLYLDNSKKTDLNKQENKK